MAAREAARQSGDPYDQLNGDSVRWGVEGYQRRKTPAEKLALARVHGTAMQSMYSGMLGTLDEDKKISKDSALFKFCRPIFDEAAKYADMSAEGAEVKDDEAIKARRIYAQLIECRGRALNEGGRNGAGDSAPVVLKRFASTGMALVGVSAVAKGAAEGVALWAKGVDTANDDAPGFKITLQNFFG